jgi:hypothetical protein
MNERIDLLVGSTSIAQHLGRDDAMPSVGG